MSELSLRQRAPQAACGNLASALGSDACPTFSDLPGRDRVPGSRVRGFTDIAAHAPTPHPHAAGTCDPMRDAPLPAPMACRSC